jgi:hypothetical protein
MTPKIKVEADLSSAEQALASFRQELTELKREASSSTGKNKFETEFQAAGTALNKLMKQYDALLKKMDSVEKSGKRYANILKEVGELTREAAKVSSKIEDFGSLKSNAKSSYFAGESGIHKSDMIRTLDQMRSEAAQARQEAHQSKWTNRAVSFASFAGGAMLGGGGLGATAGSYMGGKFGEGIGGLLSFAPGVGKVLGAFGSAAGGVLGGMTGEAYAKSKDEAIAFSQLRRAIGSTKVDFDSLRGAVRSATEGLGITYNESVKLADSFVRTSNASDVNDIGDSMHTSFGFARAYGIDPGASTNFFANARLFGATKNDQDQRRLASLIGESVSRSGTTAKTAEVLDAVSRFVSNTGRTLLEPNVAGYLSSLTSLMSSTTPGLKGNPNAAASILEQVDAAWKAGGARGDASKNYMLQAFNRKGWGMDAYDVKQAQEAGPTAWMSDVYGKNSPMYKMMELMGDTKGMRHADELAKHHVRVGDVVFDSLLLDYKNPKAAASAMKGMFNLDMQQSAAYYISKKTGMPLTGISYGLPKGYGGDPGSDYLSQKTALENKLQDKADFLTPYETAMKEFAGKAIDSLSSIDSVLKDAFGPINQSFAPESSKSGGFFSGVSSWWNGIRSDAATSKAWSGVDFNKLGLSSHQESVAQKIVDESRRQGVDPAVMLGMAMKESSLGENMSGALVTDGMHKGDRAYGVFQYMAKSSKGWNRMDDDENIRHAVADFKRNLSRFGNKEAAIAAHFAGPNYEEYTRGRLPNVGDGQSSASQYVSAIEGYESMFNRKLSAQQMLKKHPPLQASVNGTFVLQDQRGMQIADPVTISTTFPSPVPAGL